MTKPASSLSIISIWSHEETVGFDEPYEPSDLDDDGDESDDDDDEDDEDEEDDFFELLIFLYRLMDFPGNTQRNLLHIFLNGEKKNSNKQRKKIINR